MPALGVAFEMLTFAIAIGSFVLYLLAYHTYGRWLSRRLFRLDPDAVVPSRQLNDGRDYVPTRREILFGHHFTSIAGTGPIVGPALAVIWGWLPALLWVVFGSILIGAVHDLGALVVSMRNRGQTIGEVAGRLINPRVKILFLLILFLALTIVLAIFGLVIASIFSLYPASILPVWIAMPVAVVVGVLVYRRGVSPHLPALVALVIMVGAVVVAALVPAFQVDVPAFTVAGITVLPVITWSLLLFVYCYCASVLPVWVLLQPRDYVNSYQLILGLFLIVAGIGAATFLMDGGAPIVAPAVRSHVAGAPPIAPFLFVTIACGAISGFHCLVSSGTSSKQIACEPDAQFVGYGSMLTEGFLAVLVILACCAGLGLAGNRVKTALPMSLSGTEEYGVWYGHHELPDGRIARIEDSTGLKAGVIFEGPSPLTANVGGETIYTTVPGERLPLKDGYVIKRADGGVEFFGRPAWFGRYGSWSASGGLARTVSAFVDGAGNFVTAVGIPRPVAVALMAVLVASFAATTLDTATRLQRYVVQELGGTFNISPLTTRHGATALAVVTAAIVAALPPPGQTWATGMGKGGLILWPLFGAVNQLLAGLSFMVVAFYLARRKMPTWLIAIPAVLMLVVPFWAMCYQLFSEGGWLATRQYHLVVTGVVILVLELWMVSEGLRLWPRIRGVLEADLPPPRGFPVVEMSSEPSGEGGRSC